MSALVGLLDKERTLLSLPARDGAIGEILDGDALETSRERHLRIVKGWDDGVRRDRRFNPVQGDALGRAESPQDIVDCDEAGQARKLIASGRTPRSSQDSTSRQAPQRRF